MAEPIRPDIETWLKQLAVGGGRDVQLTGQQRHFLRVIEGVSRPIQEEKQWLAYFRACQADIHFQAATRPSEAAPSATSASDAAQSVDVNGREEPGFRERLAARAMYQQAQIRVTTIGETEKPTAATPAMPPASLPPSRQSPPVKGPQAVAARPTLDTESDQWTYVFWTAWYAEQVRQNQKRASQHGRAEARLSRASSVLRAVSDALQTVNDAAGSTGERVTQGVKAAAGALAKSAGSVADSAATAGRGWQASATGHGGDQTLDQWARVGKRLAATGADVASLAACAVEVLGTGAATHAQLAGSAVEGLVKGTSSVAKGVVDVQAYSDADIASLRHQIALARQVCVSQRLRLEDTDPYAGLIKNQALWDYVTIGGLTLAGAVAGREVPDDVQAAYAAAYPVESMQMDFGEKVASMDTDQSLLGLVSAVKGKLFELKYLDELNAKLAPLGLHAAMAASATQPGWDIQVTDDAGGLIELLSLKATEHVSHVREALERYPDIDVVSTSETYAALAGTPDGARVVDGGFDNVDLTDHVSGAADGHADGFATARLSLLALLPAAYRHFRDADKAAADKTSGFVEDVSRAKAATLVGQAAMLAVPYWPVALLTSVGVSMLARVGDNRREQHQRLSRMLAAIRNESMRLRRLRETLLLPAR